MIHELQTIESYKRIKPLLKGDSIPVVINGVIDGNNLGKVFVDDTESPTTAFVWAKNEMFYLIGGSNEDFYLKVESFIINNIKPEALQIGEQYFNLEVLTAEDSEAIVDRIFGNPLKRGERVPFSFDKESYLKRFAHAVIAVPSDYELKEIDRGVIVMDTGHIIATEIMKFWRSLDDFFEKGIGYCIFKHNAVIGTCISVFVSADEYEIGINTYAPEHRGKGLATAMAAAFINKCLSLGGTPHWTTEYFRKDSIAIANKLCFKQLPNYPVYYLAFEDFI